MSLMSRRTVTAVTWSLLAVLVLTTAIFRVNDFDTWFHLKTGEYILQHHMVPTHDVFSYTAQGGVWITHEWLSEVLMFLAYKLGSLTGVILLKALVVALGFLFTWLTLQRLSVNPLIGAPLLILAAFMTSFHAFARPHVATEAFLALYLYVLLSYKYRPEFRARRRRLLWLLPVQLLWANMHSGMVLGIGLFALFTVTELLQGFISRRATPSLLPRSLAPSLPSLDLGFLSLLTLGLLAVSFLNPSLHRALLYPFIITREPVFSGGIRELQSPLLRLFWGTDFFICLILMLAAGIASFIMNWRRLDLTALALFVISALAALTALRNVAIFALLAVPLVAINIQQFASHKLQASSCKRPFRHPAVIGYLLPAILLSLIVLVFFRGVRVPNDYRKPGFGSDPRIFPSSAADFVLRNNVPDHIFTTMEYGGYFIWTWYPKHQVNIDGRLDVYGPDRFKTYGEVFWSAPILDSIIQRYDINCFVLPEPPSNTAMTQNYLGRTLALRPDWSLVYFDDLSLVYLRNTPANQQLTDRFAYHALVPDLLGLPDQNPDLLQTRLEAERAVSADPESPLARTMLGVACSQTGDSSSARDAFEQALKLDPRYGDALLGLGIQYAREHDLARALTLLEKLVRAEPTNSIARLNLALAYVEDSTYGFAEQQLIRAIELNPQLIPAYSLLGDIYFQHGFPDRAHEVWENALRVSPGNAVIQKRLDQFR
jgi:tetratricopeptide (TPR) repeat protein